MDRGPWWATVQGVTHSGTGLSDEHRTPGSLLCETDLNPMLCTNLGGDTGREADGRWQTEWTYVYLYG